MKRCWRVFWRVLGGFLILLSVFVLLFFPSMMVLHTVCSNSTFISGLNTGPVHQALECGDSYAIWHGFEAGLLVGVSLFLLSFKRRAV